ncbi:MAG: hypothetical protein ACN4GW_04315 [Desulforhopalus sp.]
METMTLQEKTLTPYLAVQPDSSTSQTEALLAVTAKGSGQVITLSKEGISFGLLYPHAFSQEWDLDILDDKGGHIQQLRVRKVWEMNRFHTDFCKEFELVIGAQFVNLSKHQETALDQLLAKLHN